MRISFTHSSTAEDDGAPRFGADLPALAALIAANPAENHPRSVLITHVLDTAVAYVEAVNNVFPVARIIAIPYSASPAAVGHLRQAGFNVVVPDSVAATFVVSVREVLAALAESESHLLVQEVGGYLAHASAELGSHKNFLGVVEDTNNGHWLYERTRPHPIPVLSMAQSPLKAVEDSIIGDAVIFSVERILREEFAAICQGLRALVVGFGKIGRSTAVALKGREAVVSVYDINPAKDMSAKVEGYYPRPLHDALQECDIVVGCTGQTSLRLVDMEHIKDGAILVSASSKDIEFAIGDFLKVCEVKQFSDVVWRFTQPSGKRFYLLMKGTPVNFRDGSILGAILDMIYCELFACMVEVAAGRAPVDLSNSPPPIQDKVSKAWLSAHSRDFKAAGDDKIWDYPRSLQLGLPPK